MRSYLAGSVAAIIAIFSMAPIRAQILPAAPPADKVTMTRTILSVPAGGVSKFGFTGRATRNAIPVSGAWAQFTFNYDCGSFGGVKSALVYTRDDGTFESPPVTAISTYAGCFVDLLVEGVAPLQTLSVRIYDPASLHLKLSADRMALRTGASWSGFVGIAQDKSGSWAYEQTFTLTSPSTECASINGAQSLTYIGPAGGFPGVVPKITAGPRPTDCTLELHWGEGGESAQVGLEVFDPAQAAIAADPSPAVLYANEGFALGLRMTSPHGVALKNEPLSYAISSASAAGADLDQTAGNTDMNGHATLTGHADSFPGKYVLSVGYNGGSVAVPVEQKIRLADGPVQGNYTDLWWGGPAQNGWGVSIIQHRDTLFSVMYLYSGTEPVWMVMPGGAWDSTHTIFSGKTYLPKGSPFYAYDPSQFVLGNNNGFFSIAFQDNEHAVLSLDNYFGKPQYSITRQRFGPARSPMADHSDMWWGGSAQNGWGLSILQQYQDLFIVWYTYDGNGGSVWYVIPSGSWTSDETWEGAVYRTKGSHMLYSPLPYDPSQLVVIPVGTARIHFTGRNGTFEYTVDGHSASTPITRQDF